MDIIEKEIKKVEAHLNHLRKILDAADANSAKEQVEIMRRISAEVRYLESLKRIVKKEIT